MGWGIEMSDLVKRLRVYGDDPQDVSHGEIAEWMHKAAERIEQLEAQQKADWENINIKADAIDRWVNTSAEQHARIEQLERELAEAQKAHAFELEWRMQSRRELQGARDQLAAEKALADELGKRLEGYEVRGKLTFDAIALDRWRKARGGL